MLKVVLAPSCLTAGTRALLLFGVRSNVRLVEKLGHCLSAGLLTALHHGQAPLRGLLSNEVGTYWGSGAGGSIAMTDEAVPTARMGSNRPCQACQPSWSFAPL